MFKKILIYIGLLPSENERRHSRIFVSPYLVSEEQRRRDRQYFNELFYMISLHRSRKQQRFERLRKHRDPSMLLDIDRFISQNQDD